MQFFSEFRSKISYLVSSLIFTFMQDRRCVKDKLPAQRASSSLLSWRWRTRNLKKLSPESPIVNNRYFRVKKHSVKNNTVYTAVISHKKSRAFTNTKFAQLSHGKFVYSWAKMSIEENQRYQTCSKNAIYLQKGIRFVFTCFGSLSGYCGLMSSDFLFDIRV